MDYFAAAITLALAIIGILFSKDGKANTLTTAGCLILFLTIVSGVVAIYGIHLKVAGSQEQKKTIEQLRSEITHVRNLNIALVLGSEKKIDYAILALSVIPVPDGQGMKEGQSWLTSRIETKNYAPRDMRDSFLSVLVSKKDKKQKVVLEGEFAYSTLRFDLTPNGDEDFAVHQDIDGEKRKYICGQSCGDEMVGSSSEQSLRNRNVLATDDVAPYISLILNLSDGSAVGNAIALLQRINDPFMRIVSQFSSMDEFRKYRQVADAIDVELKFYPEDKDTSEGSCKKPIIAAVKKTIEHDASNLKSVMTLGGIEDVQLALCEEGP